VNPGTGETPTPKVFICYRREDTAAHAGRLYDSMVNRFGEGNVFMDVDMAPGVDFVERITEVVSACQVLIVVMGPSWATAEDEGGEVRIGDPDDFVRLEVETALKRREVTPIPVLVSEARMPKREALPPELQTLTRRNALELSNSRWSYDVERLHTTLDELLTDMTRSRETMAPQAAAPEPAIPVPPQPEPPTPARSIPTSSGTRLILEGIAVAAVAALLARSLASAIPEGDGNLAQILGVVLRRGTTWGLAGATLAVWLALRTGRPDHTRAGVNGLLVGALAGAIGGAIWAIPVLGPDVDLIESELATARRIEIGSLAVTAGLLGAMIGAMWRPARPGAGLFAGTAAGALFQLAVIGIHWVNEPFPPSWQIVLTFGFAAATIAGLTVATLVVLDARRAGASATAPARGP
jgi:TIR domain-containing protein